MRWLVHLPSFATRVHPNSLRALIFIMHPNSFAAFDSSSLGVPVVGVRNEKGVKGDFASLYPGIKFVVDEGDEVRSEVGIKADLFGALGGRETYVVDSKGTVAMAFNNQFQPEKHVDAAFPVIEELKASKSGGGSGGFDFSKLFGK